MSASTRLDPHAYGAAGDGTTDDRAALLAADADAVANGRGLILSAPYFIGTSATLLSNLAFEPGGSIRVASGAVLTLGENPEAGRYRIFNTSAGGTVRVTRAVVVYPEWWGARADTTTDSSPALQAALDAVGTAADHRGATVELGKGKYRCFSTLVIQRGLILRGVSGTMWYAGSQLEFADGVPGIIIRRYDSTQADERGDWSILRDLSIIALGKTVPGADGVWMKAKGVIQNCYCGGFSRYGVNIDASTSYAPPTNANNWYLENVRVQGNGSHGVYVNGADANAGLAVKVDSSANGGWGVYDNSFLGNSYVGCHTNGNTAGAYALVNANARGVLLGSYSEGGQPPSDLRRPSVAIGGLHGAGFSTTTTGHISSGDNATATEFRNHWGSVPSTGSFVAGGLGPNLFSWRGDGDHPGGYQMRWGAPSEGWFGLLHGNLQGRMPFAVGGDGATDAGGVAAQGAMWMPAGFMIGAGTSRRRQLQATQAPATGTGVQGDIAWNRNPGAGGYVGWVCVTSGTPGVWKGFGAIEP